VISLSPASVFQDLRSISWQSEADVLLLNLAAAALFVLGTAACYFAPVTCVRVGRRSVVSWVFGLAFSGVAAVALAKVTAAPQLDSWFWLQNITLFTAATTYAFLFVSVAGRVYGWAVQSVSKSLMGPGWAGLEAAPKPKTPEDHEKAQKRNRNIKRLLTLSAPDWRYVLCGFAFLSLAAIGNTFLPQLVGNTINSVAIDKNQQEFSRQVLLLVGAAFGTALFAGLRGWCFTVALARLRVRLRDRLLRALLVQELGFYDANSTGDLTSRLSSDTTAVSDQLSLNVNVFIRSLIQAVGSLVFMFILSWRLTLLAFCVIPPTIVLSQGYGKYVSRLSKQAQRRLADCNRIVEEALSSIATVRSFGAEQREADRHADMLADYYTLQHAQADAYSVYALATTFLPTVVIAQVLWCGGRLVSAGELDGGTLVSFVLYQFSLAGSFASMGDIYSGLASAVGAADKIFSLLDREPRMHMTGSYVPGKTPRPAEQEVQPTTCEGADAASGAGKHRTAASMPVPSTARASRAPAADTASGHTPTSADKAAALRGDLAFVPPAVPRAPRTPALTPCDPAVFSGSIEFRRVTFSFPTRPEVQVLQDFNLRIDPGSVVALVGPSGHGKTSIIKLLQRLYEPDAGEILLSGVPLAAFDHEWLHRTISCVNQEPLLFARSVWENITFGMDAQTEDRLGGPRALVHYPLDPGEVPSYVHVRAGPRGLASLSGGRHDEASSAAAASARRGGGERVWRSDPNQVDNVPAVMRMAVLRKRMLAAYKKAARQAVDAITVQARARLAELVLEAAGRVQQPTVAPESGVGSLNALWPSSSLQDGVESARALLLRDAGRDAVVVPVRLEKAHGAVEAAASATAAVSGRYGGEARAALFAALPPEALLNALCPEHKWNAGVPRSEVFPAAVRSLLSKPLARSKASTEDDTGSSEERRGPTAATAAAAAAVMKGGSDGLNEKEKLKRQLRRARRIREYIRSQQLTAAAAEGRSQPAAAADLLEQWGTFTEVEDLPQGAGATSTAGTTRATAAARSPRVTLSGSAQLSAGGMDANASTGGCAPPPQRNSNLRSLLAELELDEGDDDDEEDEDAALGLSQSSYGLPAATPTLEVMSQVMDAARLANAHDFIRQLLPDAYDTVLGEKAGTVSGGQRQRLCIARAIVRECAILTLDEATSALDAESEAVVTDALQKASAGRTTVIVAHRLSTIRDASRICVIQRGRVAEEGTHESLLARGGAYAKLVRRQMQQHRSEDASDGAPAAGDGGGGDSACGSGSGVGTAQVGDAIHRDGESDSD
jgi:ABC-type multidrug transport system fused ATPase/permease subunit